MRSAASWVVALSLLVGGSALAQPDLGVVPATAAAIPCTAAPAHDGGVTGSGLVPDLASNHPPLPAPLPPPSPPLLAPEPVPRCQEQPPLEQLKRSFYRTRADAHLAAIRWRTEHYGYFEGFGSPRWNRTTPLQNSAWTTFMGLKVRLNRKIIPALRCVEEELRRACVAQPYQPRLLDGIRTKNSFRSHEVSNHVYGIAIDIDNPLNPCCGCGGKLREHPGCKKQVRSVYERMAMPRCWVEVFERYGFYWLGHDVLRDTMHFEFLGDPDKILEERGTRSEERGARKKE